MNLFSKTQQQSSQKPSGKVKLSLSGTLTVRGHFSIYDCTCKVTKLEAAYLVIDAQLDRFLFLKTTQKQCTISLDYQGFQQIYDQLSKKFGFDNALFQKYGCAKEPLMACIYSNI